MIVSHEHRFIFIKTMKTAGTSIEIALSKFCGPRDIITPIDAEDEEIRRALGYRGPQNCTVPFSRYSLRQWARFAASRGRRRRFFNHMSARQIRRALPRAVWNSYYKFCVDRNPWDKVVSLYFWQHKTEPRPSLSDFIASGGIEIGVRRGGFDLYAIDGEVVVDRVCRYEQLEQELAMLAQRLRLPEVPQLPRAKANTRTDRRHYAELLSAGDSATIARVFAKEIAYLHYEFEGN
jgi:hypothetical protein